MIGTVADALQVTGAAGPWLALALVLLGIASRVARSARASARRQGERIGALELRADSERIRRQQVEDELRRRGVRLPWWPADGRPQYDPPPAYRDDEDQDDGRRYSLQEIEDSAYRDGPETAESPRIPPLPDFPRHRRSTSA